MLLLKLPQHLLLLLLVARRLALLFLPLVIHHLLHHPPRLAVQIAQTAVLGRDLGGVDRRRRGDDVRPPFHLVDFVQVDVELFARGAGFERPGGIVHADRVGEVALFVYQYRKSRFGE